MWFSSVPFGLYEQDVVSQGNPNRKVLVCTILISCYGMDVPGVIEVLLTEMQLTLS